MEALTHLALIWGFVYLAIIAAQKTKLTPVLYFLAFGSLMVNTGILPEQSNEFIRGFAEIGIILIMFALGFEENTGNFIRGIKKAWGIALFGAIAPFITAYSLAELYWNDPNISIMCGLTMTATAVSLTMVSLKGIGLQKSAAATGIMTSAVLDDVASLMMVAILVPIATGDAVVSISGIALILGKTLLFFALIVFLSVIIFPHDMKGWTGRIPIIGKLGIKHLLSFSEGEHATLTVLFVALLAGLLAHYFGFHPAIGAYMTGLILKEEYFLLDNTPNVDNYEKTKHIVDNVAFTWIGPVFFVELGTKINFNWDIFVSVIPNTLILTISLVIAQITSAALAARYTGKYTFEESMMIGFGMLGRAELAFVVIDIAYVQNPILSTEAFYTLMFTAFWLNVSVPISISLWKPYYKGQKTLPWRKA
jgi:Kef-type K+ transport system membrane component KefB